MFTPGDRVIYTRTTGNVVLGTVVQANVDRMVPLNTCTPEGDSSHIFGLPELKGPGRLGCTDTGVGG